MLLAIGDIHGRADLLSDLHAWLDDYVHADGAYDITEIYLGDYIDRGLYSRHVIDMLIERSRQRSTIFLRGNHEACLQNFLDGKLAVRDWARLGGMETLHSYGLNPTPHPSLNDDFARTMPPEHHAFFASLRTHFAEGGYFFVHAGVDPKKPLDEQSERTMLWIRDEFLNYPGRFGNVVVHGHSPVREPDFRPNRINVDTGAYATNRLSCLKIDENGPEALEWEVY
ncbi:metallophosphoesterase [Afifella sp. IM 167]|uniref:metallophosphoesterase n=1 Tax=Afifella sp. IM 167 TaxID=2033586 RepID=UPI001CCE1835|nr:metallophosphoesterase [Afifella sp. IM 167]MBZ8133269.1 serine/threonine protein phosphatase [Afifella sp. IM 167]